MLLALRFYVVIRDVAMDINKIIMSKWNYLSLDFSCVIDEAETIENHFKLIFSPFNIIEVGIKCSMLQTYVKSTQKNENNLF